MAGTQPDEPASFTPPTGNVGTRWEIAVLAALIALCLALRAANLGALPIFFDEAGHVRSAQIVATLPRPAGWLIALNYGAPPLFSWLAAPLTYLVPDPLLAVRLASALIGTLALPALWATARRLWGPAAAALAALLYALCPFALFYARLALIDGLVATCGAGALYFAIRLARDARGRDALALGLCVGAGLLTKIFAASMLLLPLLAVLAAAPAQRRAVRSKALPAMLLGLLPLLALLLTPQGGGLLSAAHAHAHTPGGPLPIIARQLATWGEALWLYLTPPVVLLALLGLWAVRRERMALLVGPWALLGGLPPALVPGAFLAPRYFLYIAVPFTLLAARGLLYVATQMLTVVSMRLRSKGVSGTGIPRLSRRGARHGAPSGGLQPARTVVPERVETRGLARRDVLPGINPGASRATRRSLPSAHSFRPQSQALTGLLLPGAVGLLLAGLTALPALGADAAIIGAPARTPLIAFDRWQYVTGWPSGYALARVVDYLRRQEARGPVTVVSSIYNPPGDALIVLLGRDRRIALTNVDFDALRRHPLHPQRGRRTFLIACRPYGQALHPDSRTLRPVLHVPNADGNGGDDVYEVIAR